MKVLIATADFGEDLEVYYAVHRLIEEGIEPVVAAPVKKRLQLVVHDFEPGYDSYTEKFGHTIEADISYDDVEPEDYDAILIPGGRAPEELRRYPKVLSIVRHFILQDKLIGAICPGPMLLYAAGSIENVELTCYEGIRTEVEMAEATYVDEEVVVSKNFVTSRGWGDMGPFFREFIARLK